MRRIRSDPQHFAVVVGFENEEIACAGDFRNVIGHMPQVSHDSNRSLTGGDDEPARLGGIVRGWHRKNANRANRVRFMMLNAMVTGGGQSQCVCSTKSGMN